MGHIFAGSSIKTCARLKRHEILLATVPFNLVKSSQGVFVRIEVALAFVRKKTIDGPSNQFKPCPNRDSIVG